MLFTKSARWTSLLIALFNLVATSKTGGLSAVMGDSSSSASLTERSGTLVLTGHGKSERGPFYFEVTK